MVQEEEPTNNASFAAREKNKIGHGAKCEVLFYYKMQMIAWLEETTLICGKLIFFAAILQPFIQSNLSKVASRVK